MGYANGNVCLVNLNGGDFSLLGMPEGATVSCLSIGTFPQVSCVPIGSGSRCSGAPPYPVKSNAPILVPRITVVPLLPAPPNGLALRLTGLHCA